MTASSRSPHHLANITSHGGVPEISRETDALALLAKGYGTSDIALKLFGRDTEETRSEVRKLVENGRAKSLGAH